MLLNVISSLHCLHTPLNPKKQRKNTHRFAQDPADFADTFIDVIVFAVAIVALRSVLLTFPKDLLSGKLVVDVLSVKLYPKTELSAALPEGTDLLCTHPMFGPESGKHSWSALPLVYETVRITGTAESSWRL